MNLLCRIFGHRWHTFDTYEDGMECQICWRWFCQPRATRTIRPTADLGEDGELIDRLRDIAALMRASTRFVSCVDRMEQAADRLILYREALAKVRPLVEAHFECVERTEALFAIDAVLSRSGE